MRKNEQNIKTTKEFDVTYVKENGGKLVKLQCRGCNLSPTKLKQKKFFTDHPSTNFQCTYTKKYKMISYSMHIDFFFLLAVNSHFPHQK